MSKKRNTPYYIGLGVIIVIFGYFAVNNVLHYMDQNKVVDSNRSDTRDPVADKFLVKHNQVPEFSFVNQDGDTITNKDLLGKVYVLDFFFTTCPTICTPMSANINRVREGLSGYEDFMTISITIDPLHDTPEVMKEYVSKFTADDSQWHLLNGGSPEKTYALSRKGFKFYVEKSDNPDIGFEHSGNFALVDSNGYIRSRKDDFGNPIFAYSGVEQDGAPDQVEEIMEDAEFLLNK